MVVLNELLGFWLVKLSNYGTMSCGREHRRDGVQEG